MPAQQNKPYAVVGSEQLTASLYKTGDELIGFKYRFNIVHLGMTTGRVTHWLGPADIEPLIKLTRVLAAVLADDGCMDGRLRQRLQTITSVLDDVLDDIQSAVGRNGDSKR